jgi:hypothetical protein
MRPVITGETTSFISTHPRDKGARVTVIGNECLILNNGRELAVIMTQELEHLNHFTKTLLIGALEELPTTTEPYKVGPHEKGMDNITVKYDTRGEVDGVTLSVGNVSVFVTRRDAATIADLIY